MKFDKKINYFVSIMEFKEINREPFIAGLLSMILGMFGVHRFYMKRKLTGFVFLMLSASSLQFGEAYLANIFIIISFIEGMVYIIKGIFLGQNKYANNNIHENKYVGKLENLIGGEKDKVDIKEELNEIEIIEVSDIKPIIIPSKNEFNNTYKNNWVKKLDLPYERNVMKVTQVKEETINFYGKLCDFIDGELRNKISSLNKEIRRIESKGGIYNNILYTIYCISEGHVTKAYSGGHSYYDPEYSYKILEGHLGQSLKEKVLTKALELEKYVSSPIEETLKYFNLTDNGLTKNWWDAEGELRASKEFTNKELNILNVTPYRNTVVWDIDVAKEQIINLYLCIWQVIWSGLKKDLKWKKKNKKTLEDIIDGKYIYFADYENGNVLASLLKVSENTIREVMPNTQTLNVSNEQDNIKKYLPKETVNDIANKLIEYKEDISDEKIKEILKGMIKRNGADWRLKVEEILMTKDNEKASILIDYKEDENFIKIAKEIIKKAEDENLLLLCVYGIGREEKLSQKILNC